MLVAEGNLTENGMHLIGEHTSAAGQKELFRGTWTALGDGRVRRFLERSRDNGATQYVWFDGTYVKKEANRKAGMLCPEVIHSDKNSAQGSSNPTGFVLRNRLHA